MNDFCNYSQPDLEKELLTLDFHGKEVKRDILAEIMRRKHWEGLKFAENQIKSLTEENLRLRSGQELAELRKENIRLVAQINDNATKRFNSFNQ